MYIFPQKTITTKTLKHKTGICNDPPGLEGRIPWNTYPLVDGEREVEARILLCKSEWPNPIGCASGTTKHEQQSCWIGVVYTTPLSLSRTESKHKHNMVADQFHKQHCPTCMYERFCVLRVKYGLIHVTINERIRADFRGAKLLKLWHLGERS